MLAISYPFMQARQSWNASNYPTTNRSSSSIARNCGCSCAPQKALRQFSVCRSPRLLASFVACPFYVPPPPPRVLLFFRILCCFFFCLRCAVLAFEIESRPNSPGEITPDMCAWQPQTFISLLSDCIAYIYIYIYLG